MRYEMKYSAINAYKNAINKKVESLNENINKIMYRIEEEIIKASNAGFFFTYFNLNITLIKKDIVEILSSINSILEENLYKTNINDILNSYSYKFNDLESIQINIYWTSDCVDQKSCRCDIRA